MSSVAPKHYLHNKETAFNGRSNRYYIGCFEDCKAACKEGALQSVQCEQNVLLKGWLVSQPVSEKT